MSEKRHSVEDVTRLLGVTPRTLHYYEEVGLLAEIGRTDGGHRYYSEGDVARLRHILRLRDVAGVSLQNIVDILAADDRLDRLKEAYRSTDSPDERDRTLLEFAELLGTLVGTLDDKIAKLEELRNGYRERLERVNALLKPKPDTNTEESE